MQIKLFTIPVGDSGTALAEMNTLPPGGGLSLRRDRLRYSFGG